MAQRGHHPKEVDAIKMKELQQQQATMAALQNSSKWEATTYVAWSQTCSTWSGHQSRSQPHGAKAMLPASSKAGPWTPHSNSYRPITVLPVRQTLCSSPHRATEQNVHTARSPVSVQERAQHTRSAAGLHSSRSSASVMACARTRSS
jgi:hypothetical protein